MATLRQIEKVTASFGSTDTSKTVTLSTTLLDTSKAFLIATWRIDSNVVAEYFVAGHIISTTQVQFVRDSDVTPGTAVEVVGYVVEFTSGITVERGNFTMTSSPDDGSTFSSIDDLSETFLLFGYTRTGSTYGNDDGISGRLVNDSGLKARFAADFAGAGAGTQQIYWEAVQLDNIAVQRGTTGSWMTTDGSKTASITAVDLSKSFVQCSVEHGGSPAIEIGDALVRAQFSDTDELTFDRGDTGTALTDVKWEVVEFTDSTDVQNVSESFAASDGQEDATITAVSGLDRAFAIASFRMSGGRADYTTDDILGEALFTLELTSTTNLQSKRAATNDASAGEFYVVDFQAAATGNPHYYYAQQ